MGLANARPRTTDEQTRRSVVKTAPEAISSGSSEGDGAGQIIASIDGTSGRVTPSDDSGANDHRRTNILAQLLWLRKSVVSHELHCEGDSLTYNHSREQRRYQQAIDEASALYVGADRAICDVGKPSVVRKMDEDTLRVGDHSDSTWISSRRVSSPSVKDKGSSALNPTSEDSTLDLFGFTMDLTDLRRAAREKRKKSAIEAGSAPDPSARHVRGQLLATEQQRFAASAIRDKWRTLKLMRRIATLVAAACGADVPVSEELLKEIKRRAKGGDRWLSFTLSGAPDYCQFCRVLKAQRQRFEEERRRMVAVLTHDAMSPTATATGAPPDHADTTGKHSPAARRWGRAINAVRQDTATSPEKTIVFVRKAADTMVFLVTRRILSTMLKGSSLLDGEIQRLGCRALASLSKGTASAAKGVLDAGGPRALVHAMRAHTDNSEVQSEACVLIINLTKHGPAGASTVREYGATQLIVDALNTHQAAPDVLIWGTAALGFLALHDVSGAAAVTAAHGHSTVVQAMLGPPQLSEPGGEDAYALFQQWGAALLSSISRHGTTYARAVADAGGASAVCCAMRAQPSDAGMQRDGALTLINLAKSDAASACAVTQAGGAQLLVSVLRAMMRQQSSKESNWVYVSGLGHLAKHGVSGAEAVAEAHGLEVIVDAMRAYPDVLTMQSWGCIAVSNLSKHVAFHPVLVERARVAVEVALQRHGDAQIVAQWGTAALKRLKRNKPRTSIRAMGEKSGSTGSLPSSREKRGKSLPTLRMVFGGGSPRGDALASPRDRNSPRTTTPSGERRKEIRQRESPRLALVSSDASADLPGLKKGSTDSNSNSKSVDSRPSWRILYSPSVV